MCSWVSTRTRSLVFPSVRVFTKKTKTTRDKLPEKLFGETSWTGQQQQRSVPFCCITLHMWLGLSVKCLDIRSPPDESTSRSQLRQTNVNLWGGERDPTVMLFPNKTNHRWDELWHLLTLMRWGFCWIHALEFFSYCEIWEWHIWPQDKYCGTTFQRHQCWPPPFSSPYHVVTNGNFAARAILARATRCNHWEMGKEVVDFGEALDAGVTAAVGAAKEWSTHTKTVTHKTKGPSWKTWKWKKK